MDYWEQQRFNVLERSFLNEPEPRDYDREEDIFSIRADLDYEDWREGEVMGGHNEWKEPLG